MRKAILLSAAVLCMSVPVPSFAGMTTTQKDECVLASRNCNSAVDDIQTEIRKIGREINKGSAVYTPQELKKLEMKLSEVKGFLNDMEKR